MNELDELKKRLEEIVTLFKRVVKTRAGATLERLRPGEGRRIDPKAWGMLFIVCLIFGFLIGFTAKKIDIHLVSKVASKPSFKKFSLMHYIFGKTVPFPGPQPDGSFVFANFEKPSDLQAWKLIKSELDTTSEISLEGSSSGKVTFYGGGEYTAISIEDLIRSRKGGSDWGAFESLSFRLYNPSSEGVTLSILITDLWGQKFHEDLAVAPWSKDVYNIPISQIAGSINHHKVDQVSFLRSAVREDAVIYLDDVRLIPSPVGATGFATATAQGPFDYGFSKRKPFWTVMDPELGGEVVRIPFIVKNETQGFCKLCPVEGGIPLPMGEVRESSRIRLRNA
ncbi:MAG: hypothetical protein HY447_02660, partial [Candidatus Omnitrophica bacterium]|nr:hypothetical protein [Candidatus Omnitrophota bacterium]